MTGLNLLRYSEDQTLGAYDAESNVHTVKWEVVLIYYITEPFGR